MNLIFVLHRWSPTSCGDHIQTGELRLAPGRLALDFIARIAVTRSIRADFETTHCTTTMFELLESNGTGATRSILQISPTKNNRRAGHKRI